MGDTTRDVRILLVERLIQQLGAQVKRRQYGSVKQTTKAERLLDEMASKTATLRYCYMDAADLAGFDDTLAIVELAPQVVGQLRDNRGVTDQQAAFLTFFAAVLGELPAAFEREDSLESATPVAVGKVLTADRAKGAKNLLSCRVEVFDTIVPIVTNLVDTRKGDLMKVARVPPAEIMGMLSAAQFVGKAAAGSSIGERPTLDDHDAREIRRAMGVLLDD